MHLSRLPFTIALLTATYLLKATPTISESEHLGRSHYKIVTDTATYLYDPTAGGFSSIIDPNGADWVAYGDPAQANYPAGAAYAYRGLPNLVHGGEDSGAGHPGFSKCSSEVVANNQIRTASLSGKWQWSWTFFDEYAKLEIEKTDEERAYWFLYEGPAGGVWEPNKTCWGTNQSGPNTETHDFYNNQKRFDHFDWFYFSSKSSDYSFWMTQVESDDAIDLYSLLGNETSGVESEDGMVVAGFGRADGAKPLLTGKHTFLIGINPTAITSKSSNKRIAKKIEVLREQNTR